MTEELLISIIIPVFNVEQHIRRALDSLENQTVDKFEVILVDDCGQDGSIKIAEEYVERDSRFKLVFHEKNLGTYHARRTGVEAALGDFVLFLDPDDELKSDALERIYSCDFSNKDILFFDIQHEPKKKWYQSEISALPIRRKRKLIESVFKKLLIKYNYISAAAAGKLFNKNKLIEVYEIVKTPKSYHYIYSEDRLLFYAYVLNSYSYVVLPYKAYIYHKNKTSITHKASLSFSSCLIDQLNYTTNKLKELVNKSDAKLLDSERAFFNFFLNESVNNQINLMRRYEDNGRNYLKYVWEAFKQIPDIKQLVRIFLYIISFKRIKL